MGTKLRGKAKQRHRKAHQKPASMVRNSLRGYTYGPNAHMPMPDDAPDEAKALWEVIKPRTT